MVTFAPNGKSWRATAHGTAIQHEVVVEKTRQEDVGFAGGYLRATKAAQENKDEAREDKKDQKKK